MKVREVMFRDLTAISPETNLRDAVQQLSRHRVGGAPVVNKDGLVVGYLSESDIIETAYPYRESPADDIMITARLSDLARELRKLGGRVAASCMTEPAVTADEDDNVEDVISTMMVNHLKVMPVTREGRLVGVVRRRDLAARIIEEGEPD